MGVRLDDPMERRRRYLAALDRVTRREIPHLDAANADDRDDGERLVTVDRDALADLIAAGNRLGRLLVDAPGMVPASSVPEVRRRVQLRAALDWWDAAHDRLGDGE